MRIFLVIDFDSTFITGESLEWLAQEALKDMSPDEQKKILQKIEKTTSLGMEGKISFEESLRLRLSLFQPNRSHIEQLVRRIERSVTPSFESSRKYIQQNAHRIRVVSGGFHEYMDPILRSFGIPQENIFANTFIFDGDHVVGFDHENVLSKPEGKIAAVREMNLDGEIIVIGDGYTDYEIVKKGVGHIFIAFTENIRREFDDKIHPIIVESFEEIIEHLSTSYIERVV